MDTPILIPERVQTSIALGESHFREFKSALEGPPDNRSPRPKRDISDDICRTLVGFANADGGELLVGVEDDGSITGLGDTTPETVNYLEKCWKDGVHKTTPLENVRVSRVSLEGKTVLYFLTGKSSTQIHLTADGRCLQRKDLSTVPTPFDEIQFSRREQTSRSFDREFVSGASVDDLDLAAVKILAEHVSSGMTPEKCLQYLGLADFGPFGLQLTNAALLIFSKEVWKWHPRSHVRVLKVSGNELQTGTSYNITTDTPIQGNLLYLIEEAWKVLRPDLTQTKLGAQGRFEASVIYPEAACREALINAIAHRDYSQEGRGIEIYIFNNRIEFTSPGGLLSSLSVSDLTKLEGAHQSRNTLVARALREIGYMREVGEGIRRMFELMSDKELEAPIISSSNTAFTVTLSNSLMYSREHILWLENFEGISLSKDEKAVIVLGYNDKHISANEIIEACGIVDIEEFRKLVEGLQSKNILVQSMTRSAAYALAKKQNKSRRDIQRWRVIVPNSNAITTRQRSAPRPAKEAARRTPLTKDNARQKVFLGNISRDVPDDEVKRLVDSAVRDCIIEWPTLFSEIGPKYAVVYLRNKVDAERLQRFMSRRDIDGLRLIARVAAIKSADS